MQSPSAKMEEHYIYEDTEVVLTGRQATRNKSTSNRRRDVDTTEIRVEITPSDKESGSWKKWVQVNDLFVIKED